MIGITYEEARNLINQTQPRSNTSWEITFIRHDSDLDEVENMHPFSNLLSSERCERQNDLPSLTLSYKENVAAEKSVLDMASLFFQIKFLLSLKKCSAFSGIILLNQHLIDPGWFKKPEQGDLFSTSVANHWEIRIDYGPQKKISLNPSVRLKADKLERALKYLGIQPTKEEQEILRQQLPRDSEGTICFGDFIQVARNLFSQQMDETGHSPVHEIAKLLDSQEAKASVEEARTLRSRIHLAEAAQKQARGMELDYEEVISLLEIEITRLKDQLADHGGQNKESVQDLRKRITVLDCQLRKSETAKKTFEVATEKLLEFVEKIFWVCFFLIILSSDRKATISSKMLLAHLGRNGHTLVASLATEAKELARSVRAILEADCEFYQIILLFLPSIFSSFSFLFYLTPIFCPFLNVPKKEYLTYFGLCHEFIMWFVKRKENNYL
uniref:Syntaxin binding protein 4 n=1 Tax=Laticauda laticaudata TaxID=8630 RepID=A0A8C5S0M4_LATLA